ncbi:alpha/beta fold hydrolase [Marinobacter subterrani]|uniref:alpha/beta fold hydrolase n=1 Tax=Marinobacter subterrani TaxID=1658765 RepID=UPI003B5A9AC7
MFNCRCLSVPNHGAEKQPESFDRPPANPPKSLTLLLASRADRLVSSRCSSQLARLWGCDLVEHPWAGHDLPPDDPDWVLAQLLNLQAATKTLS